jgi:acyl-[acyl-carrier-protein]-phospholipid O-acyltransferase/long-chain-fatty-acid--[acyl-carrier-protein] ligase
MGFIALSCLVATAYIIRLLPAEFIRLVGVTVIRGIYRIRRVHAERMPASGGVLLLPNHVTYADAFFISAATPRPVRFVMDEAFIAHRAIRIFTGIFETVTIRRDQPLEAIREIIRSLKRGEVLCFFPEGQLTRTGTLCKLQRGFELIAKKAGHPLVPLWCDGSWGSIFSFEGNRYFRKVPRRMPHGITFAFGREIQPCDATLERVRHGLHLASAEAIGSLYSGPEWAARRPKATHLAAAAFCEMDASTRHRAWVNGHQIACVNAVQRRVPIHVLEGDPLIVRLPGLLVAFAEMHDCELIFEPHFSGDKAATWIGSDTLRTAIQTSQITAEISFHHFGEKALKPMERAGLEHHPGLEVNGIVISMSMAHTPDSKDSFEPQQGHKLGSWGKLLPGWYLTRHDDGNLHAHAPSAPEEGLPLPAGCSLDAGGFLVTPPRKMVR